MTTTSPRQPIPIAGGRRVGPYELRYEIASGGMATVYLARAARLATDVWTNEAAPTRVVALKCVHPHLARLPEFVRMFVDEARLATRIEHPNVCPVVDFGQHEGTPYLVMSYLRGVPVSVLAFEELAMPIERRAAMVARLIADACEGLHAAHELRDESGAPLGVVHRDITPSNLFMGFDGIVRVLDFGIAHAEGRIQQTLSGQLKGTIAYMSPEYAQSDRQVDRRADVWSIGVVAWELLTGRRLFRRDAEIESLRAVVQAPIPLASSIRSGIPSAVERVIGRALERDIERRWQTARAFGEALFEAAREVGGVAHTSTLSEWTIQLRPAGTSSAAALIASTLRETSESVRRSVAQHTPERITMPVLELPGRSPIEPTRARAADAVIEPSTRVDDARDIDRPGPRHGSEPPPISELRTPRWLVLGSLAALFALGALGLSLIASGGANVPGWLGDQGESATRAANELVGDLARAERLGLPVPRSQSAKRQSNSDLEPEVAYERESGVESETGSESESEAGSDLDSEPESSAARESNAAPDSEPREPSLRAPSSRRAGASERGVGFANISCRGCWAEIYHRNRLLGRTPLRVQLPLGRQILTLKPFGQDQSRRLTLTIRRGREATATLSQ